jgi:hypothetical protein
MKTHNRASQLSAAGLPRPIATRRRPNGFLRGLRTVCYYLLALYIFTWVMNMFGVSTIFNSPDIHYSGIDANTGQHVVVKGCRPERLRADGSCNKSIDLPTIIEAIPRWSR